jgi:DNA-binding GntR family transcriptional regulator
VREALQMLSRDQLVVILPRRTIFVAELNPAKQLQVHEVRRDLERIIARSAAKRRTEDQRQVFYEIAGAMEAVAKNGDIAIYMKYDDLLHRLATEVAGNEFALQFSFSLLGLVRRFWYKYHAEFANLSDSALAHSKLSRCIADGNPLEAVEASDENMRLAENFIRATVTAIGS